MVRDLLGDGIPHLPELPARGVGADMVGRTAALLTDLHVETQPYGWRFVDRPGRDEGRARAFLREDLDELAEAHDGWSGPLKVQVAGPWTLGASIEVVEPGRVVISAPIGAHLLQHQGAAHAALTFAIGDSAAGFAALTLMPAGAEVMTVEMKINLLAPGLGARLIAEGRVARAGRRIVVVTADVRAVGDAGEKTVALLQGTMIPV